MRYGLVENGNLEFTMALGLGGCLTIYRRNDIDQIARRFQKKQHDARYQKFLTFFFSTLHHSTCDKIGRVVIPPVLKKIADIGSEVVIAGVLNKIEVWPKEKYQTEFKDFLEGSNGSFYQMMEEAFAFLDETKEDRADLTGKQQEEYQEI